MTVYFQSKLRFAKRVANADQGWILLRQIIERCCYCTRVTDIIKNFIRRECYKISELGKVSFLNEGHGKI